MKLKKGQTPPQNKHKRTWANRWKRWYFRLTNPYLRNWYMKRKWMEIRGNPDRNRIFRNKGSYKRDKEITEAMSLVQQIKESGISPDYILDMGSGVGFLTQLASVEFPDADIIAIDNNHKMRTDQFEAVPNAIFWEYNLNWMEFDWWMQELEGTVVIAGSHLCFNLSPRFIEIFNENPQIKLMVLSPCCHRGFENYDRWMENLYDRIETNNKEMWRDSNILSIRDGVLIANR